MADIKTHLRELSFCLQMGVLKNQLEINISDLSPNKFFELSNGVISNDINSARNILCSQFDNEQKQIIINGARLANSIFESHYFDIKAVDKIYWLGNDTQKEDVIDVQIGQYGFSLKEESFILENMGLYKFVNLLTDSNYKKGLHIFREFSKDEYENWFLYTWDLLVDSISQECFIYDKRDKYTSVIEIKGDEIVFSYMSFGKVLTLELPKKLDSWTDFMDQTDSVIREKVFGKWVNEIASKDPKYVELKSYCAHISGNNLVNHLASHLSKNGLARLLQIYDSAYFYAKVTNHSISVFKVPSLVDFLDEIEVVDISYSVPKSQLNVLTTIKNKKTKKSILIRNECRFSHGQFNGTPEAKMYYDKNSNLADVYIPIL